MSKDSAQRVGAFSGLYIAVYGYLGVQLPFFPGWLDARGFTPEAIGLLFGGALALRLLVAPALAFRSESAPDPRLPLRLAAGAMLSAVFFLLLPLPLGVHAAAAVAMLFLFGLIVPLSDTTVMREDAAGRLDYGRTRALGSAAFIGANLLGGLAITATTDEGAVWWMAAFVAGMMLASLGLPRRPRAPRQARPSLREASALFRSKSFLLMVGAAGLCQGSHAVYYTFSELHWSALGYPSWLIGALWTTGVSAEILVLVKGRAILSRIDPPLLIALGCLSAALRWPAIGLSPPLWLLFMIQIGHAGTFTCTYLGTVAFISRAVPDTYQATAMTLTSTLGVGALTGIAAMIAGQIFQPEAPLPAYLMVAGMGAVGGVFALLLLRRWDGGTLAALPAGEDAVKA